MGDAQPDSASARPDRAGLFQLASEQRGYFTTAQARDHGYSRALLAHHAGTGTLRRVRTGLYRFRDYPSTPREEVVAAWLSVGRDDAVVSHESALDLWELTDLIPDAIHLTVPRTRRHLPRIAGVRIHTTTRPFEAEDLRWHEGARVTAPVRTLLDVAEAGGAPDQVVRGVRQALERGWIDRVRLGERSAARGQRVARLVDEALADAVAAAPTRRGTRLAKASAPRWNGASSRGRRRLG